jgi:2-haloacid dehalogenase
MRTVMDGVEALVFDVFGTVVDWRSSVEQELKSLGRKYNIGEINEKLNAHYDD